MSTHSVAEAMEKLEDLIDRAQKGEEIVIEHDGRALVELKAIPAVQPERRVTAEDIEWLDKHRVGSAGPIDAGTLVSTLRDEEWDR